jgi:selenocysteine lyase/cysteine desulfurase
VRVAVDAAQLAPHRPLPASPDFVSWSGHKMYAPFGAGVLVGPRAAFATGDPFLAGGGAVDLVDLDEVVWTEPPDREEAGSPNVVGAVALAAAVGEFERLGWDAVEAHDATVGQALRAAVAGVPGVTVLGPGSGVPTLPVVTFTVEGVPHALVAARLSAEFGIGVRHGCFCAHPYLIRLLGLSAADVAAYRDDVRRGERRFIPGAIRASASLSTTLEDVERLADALRHVTDGTAPPVDYEQDVRTGDFHVRGHTGAGADAGRRIGAGCARG